MVWGSNYKWLIIHFTHETICFDDNEDIYGEYVLLSFKNSCCLKTTFLLAAGQQVRSRPVPVVSTWRYLGHHDGGQQRTTLTPPCPRPSFKHNQTTPNMSIECYDWRRKHLAAAVLSRASNECSRRIHNHREGPSGWKHLLALSHLRHY